ncbi:MAG TPA: zinc-binding alcohol dehydrogenase family protein [Opitutaceae bacterium]|nr:zinc-binding alcohol dehydrogenase family protein [Opitutaceae bacterium]
MRAVRIDRPGSVSFVDIPHPTPKPGEVLLAVKRVGYCGSDLSTFRGANPLVNYPRIPGHEIGAVVAELTKGVPPEFAVGSAVTVVPYTACGECASCRRGRFNACQNNQTLGVQRDGALTEFIAVPWEKLRAAPLSLDELALVEPLSVGFHAADRGRIHSADTVLVIGCGMIGLGAIAAAAQRGATVIAADVAATKFPLAMKAGAKHALDAGAGKFHEQLLALSDGRGPDVVIEAVGAVATYQMAVAEVAFAGRVVYIGYGKAPVSYETKQFVLKELDILGSRNATPQDFDAVIEMLRRIQYPTTETITRSVPWTEAANALTDWAANPGAVTKIHVQVSE